MFLYSPIKLATYSFHWDLRIHLLNNGNSVVSIAVFRGLSFFTGRGGACLWGGPRGGPIFFQWTKGGGPEFFESQRGGRGGKFFLIFFSIQDHTQTGMNDQPLTFYLRDRPLISWEGAWCKMKKKQTEGRWRHAGKIFIRWKWPTVQSRPPPQ